MKNCQASQKVRKSTTPHQSLASQMKMKLASTKKDKIRTTTMVKPAWKISLRAKVRTAFQSTNAATEHDTVVMVPTSFCVLLTSHQVIKLALSGVIVMLVSVQQRVHSTLYIRKLISERSLVVNMRN